MLDFNENNIIVMNIHQNIEIKRDKDRIYAQLKKIQLILEQFLPNKYINRSLKMLYITIVFLK